MLVKCKLNEELITVIKPVFKHQNIDYTTRYSNCNRDISTVPLDIIRSKQIAIKVCNKQYGLCYKCQHKLCNDVLRMHSLHLSQSRGGLFLDKM